MKFLIKSIYSNIFLLIFLTFVSYFFIGMIPTHAQSLSGLNEVTILIEIQGGKTQMRLKSYPSVADSWSLVTPNPNLEFFTTGVQDGNYYIKLPAPLVAQLRDLNNTPIDSTVPNNIVIDNNFNTDPKTYISSKTKICESSSCSTNMDIPLNTISALTNTGDFNIPILDANNKQTGRFRTYKPLVDPTGKFLSKDQDLLPIPTSDYNTKFLASEFCFKNQVIFDKTINIQGKPAVLPYNYGPRQIIGSQVLESYNVFPPFLSNSKQYKCYNPQPQGTNFINATNSFTSESQPPKSTNINAPTGILKGEFLETPNFGSLNCNFSSTTPLISSDLFGNTTMGVQTALGCLPGSINGVFAVILRISIGISSVVLFLLIIMNAITIMGSKNDPNKIKVASGNISKGVLSIFIIIFSVFILNFIGVKIIPLGSLGGSNIEQLTQ